MTMKKNITQKIRAILDSRYKKDAKEMYYVEIYADRNDVIDDEDIVKILSSDNPIEYLHTWLSEVYKEFIRGEASEALLLLMQDDCLSQVSTKLLLDTLFENFEVRIPVEHCLKQELPVNIMVDTGDGQHDYRLNTVYPHCHGSYSDVISDNASLTWLVKQQGYYKDCLVHALRVDANGNSKLLRTILDELFNCSSPRSALVFLVSVSLGELIDLREQMRTNINGTIKLSKSTKCGICDFISNSCGSLRIILEQDVILPLKYIASATVEGENGYNIRAIHVHTKEYWKQGKIIREDNTNELN